MSDLNLPAGVYAAATVDEIPEALWELIYFLEDDQDAVKSPQDDLHVTLLYSPTGIAEDAVKSVLDCIALPMHVKVKHASLFDAWVEDELDPDHATLVLELDDALLGPINKTFLELGATSTYAQYNPHVSLYTHVPRELAEAAQAKLNAELSTSTYYLHLPMVYTEPLDPSHN
jgi:hypothetical protein